jgi:2-amino-4-hydroxy-6-hydroxymethyldihydropteridine diphosphokinase
MPGAPDFINAVVAFETSLHPFALLRSLQEIEARLGRPKDHRKNESRTIDLDIICYGDLSIDEKELTIPHPRAAQRDFVMTPLKEVAPDVAL